MLWALCRGLAGVRNGKAPLLAIREIMSKVDYGYYSRYGDFQDFIVILMTGIFGSLAFVSVVWFWIKTATNVNHMAEAYSLLRKYKNILVGYHLFAWTTIMGAHFADRFSENIGSLVGLALPCLTFFWLALCAWAGITFMRLLAAGEANAGDYHGRGKLGFKVTRINVKWTTRAVIVGLLLLTFSWFAYSLLDNIYGIRTFTNQAYFGLVLPALLELLSITGANIVAFTLGVSIFNHAVPNAASGVRESIKSLAKSSLTVVPRMFGSNSSHNKENSNDVDSSSAEIVAKEVAKRWSVKLAREAKGQDSNEDKPEATV